MTMMILGNNSRYFQWS